MTSAFVALCLLYVPAGCGADTEQARKHMANGDRLVQQLQVEAREWESEISSSMETAGDPAAFKDVIDEARSSAGRFFDTISEAKDEFGKIHALSGVPEYAKYAALQVEALENFQKLIDETSLFFGEMAAQVDRGDVNSLSAAQERYFRQVNSLTDEISKLDEKAQKLKLEKDL